MPAKLKAAVVGATGYTGFELTRLPKYFPRLLEMVATPCSHFPGRP